MSSITATPSRNATSPAGILRPRTASAPRAKATSVAIGMPQPFGALPAADDGQEDQRRHQHAPQGRDDGEQGRAGARQLPHRELALDLEADDQEEDGHEAVVDEVADGLLEREVAHRDRDLGRPEVLVGRAGDVGPDQRRDRRAEQHQASGHLQAEELLERPHHQARHGPLRARPRPPGPLGGRVARHRGIRPDTLPGGTGAPPQERAAVRPAARRPRRRCRGRGARRRPRGGRSSDRRASRRSRRRPARRSPRGPAPRRRRAAVRASR